MVKRIFKTGLQIQKIKAPACGQVDYYDHYSPLGIRISQKGTKTFFVMAGVIEDGKRKQKRINIGHFGAISLKSARYYAREYRDMAKDGHDPRALIADHRNQIIEESKCTFQNMRDKFLERYCRRELRQRSYNEYKRILKSDDFKPWLQKSIKRIDRKEIVALLDGLHDRKAFIMANRYRAILNKFMNWCADKGYIEEVPAMPKPGKEKSRDRILSDQQLINVWQGVEATNNIFQPFVKLLILTGQRRSELSHMRWKELHNLDAANPYWTIPAENAKNGQAHDVPLSPQAVNVIKSIPHSVNSQYCFATNRQTPINGISKMKAKLDQTIKNICDQDGRDPVTAWKLHDLRRTAASGMAGLNVSPHVVEKILNHTSGTISGVAAVYNRYDYAQEKRAALDKWGEYVESLVTGKKAQEDNIIPLYQKEAFS